MNFMWSEWKRFPDPRLGEYLTAPLGPGVYQLWNARTKELVLFGKGNSVAYRMASLLPAPLGQGTRNNSQKREYVLKNLEDIRYGTRACKNEGEAVEAENELRAVGNHIFNA